jgi:hypothetical protein
MLAMRAFIQISFVNLNFLNSNLGFPEEHSGVRILPLSRAEHNELVNRLRYSFSRAPLFSFAGLFSRGPR